MCTENHSFLLKTETLYVGVARKNTAICTRCVNRSIAPSTLVKNLFIRKCGRCFQSPKSQSMQRKIHATYWQFFLQHLVLFKNYNFKLFFKSAILPAMYGRFIDKLFSIAWNGLGLGYNGNTMSLKA